jgi:HAD superfamily hydrolase (TIGR01509 family)
MIKLILFDLDGVLVDTKEIHFKCLNEAIEYYSDSSKIITLSEHHSKYDGLKTFDKLSHLTKEKGLDSNLHDLIWNKKQELTLNELYKLNKSNILIDIFETLKRENFILGCCSNSIRKTIQTVLDRIGISCYIDIVLSNEDVLYPKPYPEIYWKAMQSFGIFPEDTLIVEDSPTGLMAAYRSSANVLRVNSPEDLTLDKILNKTKTNKFIPKWQGNTMNILIPMAGAGSRFEQAGYTFPKPLIDVNGKPMIQVVVENLNVDGRFIYVVQKKHREKYNLDSLLNLITPGCKIVEVDGITEGAACTTLLAKEFIDNDEPLLMANSDQFVEWNSNEFLYKMQESSIDGGIVTFSATHPKWSFAKIDEYGFVTEVAEKKPISDIATAGIYYWTKGSDYVKYAEQMIEKNIRINNEFYVCPIFNEAIYDNKKIKSFTINNMCGLGTPEDLKYFLDHSN